MAERDEVRGLQDALEAMPPSQAQLFPGLADARAADAAAARAAGRPPGAQNKATIAAREEVERLAAETGLTPLAYLWNRMVDPRVDKDERHKSAVALLPYTARKTPVDVNVENRTFSLTMQLGEGDAVGESGDLVIEGRSDE